MEEKLKITRLVRKRLEEYFNREIIEREFDPSGNGLHATTPLVANLELAYQIAIDRPYRNVSKHQKKLLTSGKESNDDIQSLIGSLIPLTKRDTKLKGRAQPQDIKRLSRHSETTLNDLSMKEIIGVHRFRCQGVPFQHVNNGKVPHVSHHVHAYLNAGEALRYSVERDERKSARHYRTSKCKDFKSKNLHNGNRREAGSEMYSPRSTLIDFRRLPLKTNSADGTVSQSANQTFGRTEKMSKKDSTKAAHTVEPTFQISLMSDNQSQNSSVRQFYIRQDSGILPGDLVSPSKDIPSITFTQRNPHSHTPGKTLISSQEARTKGTLLINENGNEVKSDKGIHKAVATDDSDDTQVNVHSDPQVHRYDEDSSDMSAKRDGHRSTEADSMRQESEKDHNVRDSGDSLVVTSTFSNSSSSPESTSGRRRSRLNTTRHGSHERTFDETSNDSQDSKQSSLQTSEYSPAPDHHNVMIRDAEINDKRDTASPPDKTADNVNLMSEGSHDSIGDSSSLIDESYIKSLSLEDTFSGSYSLDFEDEEESSSAFDTVSYHSRTRSKNGFIRVPNQIEQRDRSRNSGSRESSITEEYIRTESVISLR